MTRDPASGDWLDDFDLAVVLGGGNALGAFHLGVCEALLDGGARPTWYVGASIGAVTAAILVGNPPAARLDRLREFWAGRAQADPPWISLLPDEARARWSNAFGLQAALGGRPGLAAPRLPGLLSILPGMPPDRAIQHLAPLRHTLEKLVDFDRLNAAPERLSVVATDLATGEEAWFDTRDGGIGPDELLASAALLPLFPPVEIGGRVLADGGLSNNLPVERPFSEPARRPLLCVASDLYGLGGVAPTSLDGATTRAQDLGFAAQARRGIDQLARERDLRRRLDPEDPPAILAHLAYDAPAHERSLKALDFSTTALRERAAQGRRAISALRSFLHRAPRTQALAVVRPTVRGPSPTTALPQAPRSGA